MLDTVRTVAPAGLRKGTVQSNVRLHRRFSQKGPGIRGGFRGAKERGLSFVFHPAELREAHPNTAVLTVEGASGKKTKVQAASIGGGRIRVDQLDGVGGGFPRIFNTLIALLMPPSESTLVRVASSPGTSM